MFEKAVKTLFEKFGTPALYQGRNIKVILKQPDVINTFLDARVHSETRMLECLIKDAPTLAVGDVLKIGDLDYTVNSEPVRDIHHLIWKCECV